MKQTEHQDTTTPEGWENVVAHKLAGGDVEINQAGGCWSDGNEHPKDWEDDRIYRIKPVRSPAVGDVWKHKDKGVRLINFGDGILIRFNGEMIDVRTTDFWSYWEYIGTIPLDLLMGES